MRSPAGTRLSRTGPSVRTRPSRRRTATTILAALTLAACGGRAPTAALVADQGGEPATVELTVFAAASLRAAFGAVKESYEAATPGVVVAFSFDGSGTLRTQLEQGAPADLFASADKVNPRILADAGLTAGRPVGFAGNRLAIVVPAGNPAAIASPFDLARPGVRLVGAAANVPITAYAAQLLRNLASLPGAAGGFVDAVDANVVSREDNVRAALAKVELGEGDAAIVYATDAAGAGDAIRVIPIPDQANVAITYTAVVLREAPHREAATALLAWLAGPEGRAVLARFGFEPPPHP